MCRLSLGNRRIRRHGPLIISGFLSVVPFPFATEFDGVELRSDSVEGAGIESLSGVSKSVVDFDGTGASDNLFISVPGDGAAAKSLYELSVMRGIFHGKRLRDIQQNIIARDQISVGCGSYFLSSYTSGARYGSDPTIPVLC